MPCVKISIPVALLQRAAKNGWTLTRIRRVLVAMGRKVSHETIRHRLGELGIQLRLQYSPATPERVAARRQAEQKGSGPRVPKVVGRNGKDEIGLYSKDDRLVRQMNAAWENYLATRNDLQWRAREGCRESARVLRERFALRIYSPKEILAYQRSLKS